MLYPLKFEPVYKNILWGGRNIEKKLERQIPDGNIAESWEVCCRNDGMSVITNGALKGWTLEKAIETFKEDLLGDMVYSRFGSNFPIFIKIIDANDKLSVQVHPGDEYAAKNGEGSGKTEMWYIIDARPGAKLVYGLKENTTKNDFLTAVSSNNLESILNEVPVSPGDVFYIPAGTIHAILDGILIAEIQQNSNTTYRVYDWGRVDKNGNRRELHINKALDVINFNYRSSLNCKQSIERFNNYTMKTLSSSPYFTVEELKIESCYNANALGSNFHIFMVIEGKGEIRFAGGSETLQLSETIMVPASLGEYEIRGNLKVLKVYI